MRPVKVKVPTCTNCRHARRLHNYSIETLSEEAKAFALKKEIPLQFIPGIKVKCSVENCECKEYVA